MSISMFDFTTNDVFRRAILTQHIETKTPVMLMVTACPEICCVFAGSILLRYFKS